MLRHSVFEEEICQYEDHILRENSSRDETHQAFSRVLVDNVEDPKGPAISGPIGYEIVGPDVVSMSGPKPDARAIGKP